MLKGLTVFNLTPETSRILTSCFVKSVRLRDQDESYRLLLFFVYFPFLHQQRKISYNNHRRQLDYGFEGRMDARIVRYSKKKKVMYTKQVTCIYLPINGSQVQDQDKQDKQIIKRLNRR